MGKGKGKEEAKEFQQVIVKLEDVWEMIKDDIRRSKSREEINSQIEIFQRSQPTKLSLDSDAL